MVLGDDAHLRQAIANLTANAVKHTAAGSPIDVSARLVEGRGVVAVRDHGTGLDADGLAHVFDRFWQADKARTGAGAGLGLSIVEGVAAEHRGTATAANAPDGGAIFEISIPAS
jgi:two-component system, OmpR family, sensor kinase